jgi:sugar (glycoside-pentoside-hexuronide) transporter
MSNEKIKFKELSSYFSYGFGQCLSFGLIGTFIIIFYVDVLGISAIAASTIFVIARTWDAVNDPMVAGFMDTLRFKEGKFKGYLKIMPIFIVGITALCFVNLDVSNTWKVIWAGATYILWGMIYTVSDVPFWSMSAVMTIDTQERTKLISAANLGVFGGIGAAALLLTPLLEVVGNIYPSQKYLIAVSIIMLMALPLMFLGYKNTKERVVPVTEKVKLREVFATVKSNNHMFKVLFIFFNNVFMNIVQGIIIFFFTYNMGNAGLMTAFGLIGIGSTIAFFALPFLTRKFRKKDILLTILVLDIALRIVFYNQGYDNLLLILTFLAIGQVLYSCTGPIISTMLAETIEYSELKSGRRCEAIVFSGQTFFGKLSVAFAGGLIGLILTYIGYVPNQPQSQYTTAALFLIISLLPALGSLIRVLILVTYKYTEKEHKEVVALLESKKGTVAEAATI